MITDNTSPLHIPTSRTWELNENSTQWDIFLAAPSDREMRLRWILWASILFVVVIITVSVFLSVIIATVARRNSFNFYLIFLMIPDLVYTFPCFIQCLVQSVLGHYWSESSCYFQSFIVTFGISGNCWMNAIIARELYHMLSLGKEMRRYRQPTCIRITLQIFLVYIWSTFISSWGYIDTDWFPHKTRLINGVACLPIGYDMKSTVFFFTVFLPLLIGLPMGYVLLCFIKIRVNGLMPASGSRRFLTIYFIRLAAVFVVMWLPSMVLMYLAGPWVPQWLFWAGGTWSHLQGAVSAIATLYKTDVYHAFRNLVSCKTLTLERKRNTNDSTFFGVSESQQQFAIRDIVRVPVSAMSAFSEYMTNPRRDDIMSKGQEIEQRIAECDQDIEHQGQSQKRCNLDNRNDNNCLEMTQSEIMQEIQDTTESSDDKNVVGCNDIDQ